MLMHDKTMNLLIKVESIKTVIIGFSPGECERECCLVMSSLKWEADTTVYI